VIRRYRIHEACERARTGQVPSWSSIAAELGYFDQAHFVRDFKAQVGMTPGQYADCCADRCRAG
jgi:AraC-like DNA-binding protein